MTRSRKLQLIPAVAMAVAGAVIAFATAEGWVLSLGLTAAVLFWLLSPKDAADELPKGLDAGHLSRARRLLATRDRLLAELDATPEAIRDGLVTSAVSIRELVRKSLAVLAKHQELGAHLEHDDVRALGSERQRLASVAGSAGDALAKERCDQAVAAIDAQVALCAELRGNADQLDAEVAAIQASLEGLVARLVKMKSAEVRASFESESGHGARMLNELTTEVQTISESLESVYRGQTKTSRER